MKRIPAKIRKKAQKIKLLLLDVDGVLTDGQIVMDDRGQETKHFDVRDGHGIRLLIRAGIDVGLITGRSSKVVNHRAKDLGIRMVYQKVYNKIEVYREIKRKTGYKDQEIAYVGDDLMDIAVLRNVGLAMTVKDCWGDLKRTVDYVSTKEGGRGAVREMAELLLIAQGKWGAITQRYFQG